VIPQPIIETKRLLLRPFDVEDAARVKLLADDERIADVTASIPHPYPEGLAESWIMSHPVEWGNGKLAAFAIVLKEQDLLIGCITIMNIMEHEGELGYWVGTDFWNNGYCSEACKSIVDFGFKFLKLNRIHAHHLSRNPASGCVLLKSGLIHIGEGVIMCGYRKERESIELYERVYT